MSVVRFAILILPTATAASAPAKLSVTALPNKTLVQTDTAFHILGSVTSTTTPLVARLQQFVLKHWSYVASARTSAAGTYILFMKETQIGTDTFRVAIFKTAKMPLPTTVPLAISPSVKVTIATWTYLSNWKTVEQSGGDINAGQVHINGATYNSSIYFENDNDDPGSTDYMGFNLNRHCYSLTGVLGLDDQDASGMYGEFTVLTDGKTVLNAALPLRQTSQMNLNVSGVLRLDLEVTFSDQGANPGSGFFPNYTMDYGNPQVFCSYAP